MNAQKHDLWWKTELLINLIKGVWAGHRNILPGECRRGHFRLSGICF